MFNEDEYITLSAFQHLAFCERQWGLIYLDNVWRENVLTAEGRAMHDHVHAEGASSKDGVRLVRGLWLKNEALGIYGVADMVEFRRSDHGVRIPRMRGRSIPYPVEYKHGKNRPDDADELQLTAQAVCLEEMFGVSVARGAIFYGRPKRRIEVDIDRTLRKRLVDMCELARAMMAGKLQPSPRVGRHCKSCSLADDCMPDVVASDASSAYVEEVKRFAAHT